MGEVQMGFVHHTVSANEYAPGDSAGHGARHLPLPPQRQRVGRHRLQLPRRQVRPGLRGPAGGIDQPVVGAQAQGFNAVSTGVANLGTYSDVPQTEQAIDAMSRLLAWKLPLHGAPVTGKVTVTSAGGSSNRHPKGAA
jgi:hypothetical protein